VDWVYTARDRRRVWTGFIRLGTGGGCGLGL
jgi:hypothetical protein